MRWINARFASRCPCGETVEAGFRALKVGTIVWCRPCGDRIMARSAEREERARGAYAAGRRTGVED